jgi:hypothetical protein
LFLGSRSTGSAKRIWARETLVTHVIGAGLSATAAAARPPKECPVTTGLAGRDWM